MSAIEQFQGQSLMAQADMLSKSGIVPKAFRGKPADVLAACLWGAEIGLGPMASMGYIDVIEGTPTINAEGCNALVRRAGHSLIVKATPTSAVAKGTRRDTGDTMTVEWTIDMARRAGLANKQVWKSYPEAMLTARAVTQLCRSLFPDVLAGISYAPEEAASFAAPEMLDAQPERLAGQQQAALPAPGTPEHVIVFSDEEGGPTPPPRAQAAQSKPRAFAPPGQRKTDAELNAEAKALLHPDEKPFTAEDQTLCRPDELKALHKEIDGLDLEAASELADAWKAAGLPSVKNKKSYDKAAYETAMALVLDAKEAMDIRLTDAKNEAMVARGEQLTAEEIAAEPFFQDDEVAS